MIISKTPMRLSFAGGGSDLPVYYRENGGAVLSTSINKFVFICVNKAFDNGIRVAYSKTEEVTNVSDLQHKLVKAVLEKLKISGGIEIASIADIPSKGSGLGSSSAFTVGLLHALHAYQGRYVSSEALASEACEIEIDICGEPIGKQDQYAAAAGGINFIRFNADDSVDVEPVIMPRGALAELESSLMMFYTGIVRSASAVLKVQAQNIVSDQVKWQSTKRLVDLASELRDELSCGRVDAIGEAMHQGWMLKKSLADGISNATLDDCYARARAAGALGGKLLGAGGGGFFVFYVPKERQNEVKAAMSPLQQIEFGIDRRGASIVFYQ